MKRTNREIQNRFSSPSCWEPAMCHADEDDERCEKCSFQSVALQRLFLGCPGALPSAGPPKAVLPPARTSQHRGADGARGHIDLRPLSPQGARKSQRQSTWCCARAGGAADTGDARGSLRQSTARSGRPRDRLRARPQSLTTAHRTALPLAVFAVRHISPASPPISGRSIGCPFRGA